MDQQISAAEAARRYIQRGFAPVPVPSCKKGPVRKGWQHYRAKEADLDADFAEPSNIGILLGEPSGWLVDVDLDCDEAVELAPKYLPATGMKSGREGRPVSHWWFICIGAKTQRLEMRGSQTPRHDGDDAAMPNRERGVVLELRSTGAQTLVGPSLHPDGSRYDMLTGEPAEVTIEQMMTALKALHRAVLAKRTGKSEDSPEHVESATGRMISTRHDVLVRASRYLAKMPASISGQGGHDHCYAAATVLVHGFGLQREEAHRLLREEYNPRCEPPWSEAELAHKVEDAATKPHEMPLGWLLNNKEAKSLAAPRTAPDGTLLPIVTIDTDEHRVVNEVIEILSRDPELYVRGNSLVRLVSTAESVLARTQTRTIREAPLPTSASASRRT